jgi:hypothetical protein
VGQLPVPFFAQVTMLLRGFRPPRAFWIALLGGLGAFAAWWHVQFYPLHLAMDLYHPWGIPKAHAALPGMNPYADTSAYGAYIEGLWRGSTSNILVWVGAFWEWRHPNGIEPTGTPFYYAVQAFSPADYDFMHLLYTLADFAAAGASVFWIARLRGAARLPALCAVALVFATFNPFIQDVRVSNVNSLQLLVLVAMVAMAQQRLWDRHPAVDKLYVPLAALFLVFKPNTIIIVAALVAHYAVVRGPRRFAIGALLAVPVALAAMAYGAWYFGSAGVWLDWYRYTQGLNGGTLVYSLVKGNMSLPVMLSERGEIYGSTGYAVILAVAFAVALLVAATSTGREPERAWPTLRHWFEDPWRAASIAAVFMFATSPLLWPHYLMFALIPLAWMLRPEGERDIAPACAVVSFVLFSRALLQPMVLMEMNRLAYTVMMFAWVPLLVGLFARLRVRPGEEPAKASEPALA